MYQTDLFSVKMFTYCNLFKIILKKKNLDGPH